MEKIFLYIDFLQPFYSEENNDKQKLLVYIDNIYMIQLFFDNYIKNTEDYNDILVNIKINILNTKNNNRFQSNIFLTSMNNIINNQFYFSIPFENKYNNHGINKNNMNLIWKSKNDTKTNSIFIIEDIYVLT